DPAGTPGRVRMDRRPFRPPRGTAGASSGARSGGSGRLHSGGLAGTARCLRAPGSRGPPVSGIAAIGHLPLPAPAVILGPVPKVNNDTEIGPFAAGRVG